MTVVETDRIDMADESDTNDELTLDSMFDWLEQSPAPEGYKTEIVGGNVFMAPQRDTRWAIIRRVVRALEDTFGMNVLVMSDVRIDFPGHLNGFAPDVAKLRTGATKNARGLWRYQDLEFVTEVISTSTSANDYGPKKAAYAAASRPTWS